MWSQRLVVAVFLALAALALGRAVAPAHAADDAARHLSCRQFKQSLDEARRLDTSDRTSEVGTWVSEMAAEGWRVHDVDLEMVSSATGYPRAWVQVCVVR